MRCVAALVWRETSPSRFLPVRSMSSMRAHDARPAALASVPCMRSRPGRVSVHALPRKHGAALGSAGGQRGRERRKGERIGAATSSAQRTSGREHSHCTSAHGAIRDRKKMCFALDFHHAQCSESVGFSAVVSQDYTKVLCFCTHENQPMAANGSQMELSEKRSQARCLRCSAGRRACRACFSCSVVCFCREFLPPSSVAARTDTERFAP